MSEDFLLKWNDHHTLFFVGAEELCESEEYTDVTLAAGSKFFSAHKLVLSICSPYFRQLFRRLGKDKPVVYLKDVDPKHLDLLLQYMYKGEIKVQENELVSVLNTAQGLEIKGLSENSETNNSRSSSSLPKSESIFSNHSTAKRPLTLPASQSYDQTQKKRQKTFGMSASTKPSSIQPDEQLQTPSLLPDPGTTEPFMPVKQEITPVTIDLDDGDTSADLGDSTLAGFEALGQELAFCDTSGTTGYEGEMGYDEGEYFAGMEPHTTEADRGFVSQGEVFQCDICCKQFKVSRDLEVHYRVHTGERPYPCRLAECQHKFKTQSHRARHERTCQFGKYVA